MRVHWTARALARLDAICSYIAKDSPPAAAAMERRLLLRSRQIAAHPRSGRMVPDYERDDVRELIEGNYRIIYRIRTDQVDVVAVMHCAQLLPDDVRGLEGRRR
jgi:plasmid stabilization system protein ParE